MTDDAPEVDPQVRGGRFCANLLSWARRQNSFVWLIALATFIHVMVLWFLSDFSLYHSHIATQPAAVTASYETEVAWVDPSSRVPALPGTVASSVSSPSPGPSKLAPLPAPISSLTSPPVLSAHLVSTVPHAVPASNALPSSAPPRLNASAMTGVNRSKQIALFNLNVSSERVVYLIDFSGSMWRKIDTRTRYEVACQQVRKSIQGLGPQTQFDVVIFADHAVSFEPQLIAADEQGKKRAQEFLDHVPDQEGSTNLVAGLQAAISLQPDCVFLLTDGIANMPEWEVFDKVREMQRTVSTPARLYAIGLVDFPDSDGGIFLQKLTRSNGGNFVPYLSWSQEVN